MPSSKAEESRHAFDAFSIAMQHRNRPMQGGRMQHVDTYAKLSLAHPHLYKHGKRNVRVAKARSSIHKVLEERMREKALLDKNIKIVLHNIHLLNSYPHSRLEIHAKRDQRTLTHNHNQHHVENDPHWENIENEHRQFDWQDFEGPREIILDIEHADEDEVHIYEISRRDRFGSLLGPAYYHYRYQNIQSILESFMGGRNRYRFTHVYLFTRKGHRTEIPIAK